MTNAELRKEAYELLEVIDFQSHKYPVGVHFELRQNGHIHKYESTASGITHTGSHDNEAVIGAIGLLRESFEWIQATALRYQN